MLFTGSIHSLNRAMARASMFRTAVFSLLLSGAIVGATNLQAHAAEKYVNNGVTKEHVFTQKDMQSKDIQQTMRNIQDMSDRALYYNAIKGQSYDKAMKSARKDQNINQLTGNSSNTNGLSKSNNFVNSLRQGVNNPHKVLKQQPKQQKQQKQQNRQIEDALDQLL